jgi:hypothetical protein
LKNLQKGLVGLCIVRKALLDEEKDVD